MKKYDYLLNEKIHATIINPYLSLDQLKINCELINKYKINSISTSLNYLSFLKESKSSHIKKINTLISYPLADTPTDFIRDFIVYAKNNGADGIEYLPKIFLLYKNDENNFAIDIEKISNENIPITIILNSRKMNEDILEKAIKIASELGVKNFQLGDGFSPSPNANEIINVKKFLDDKSLIKVVGGIKKIKQAIEVFDAGADYIGTSNFYEIFQEIINN